MRLAIFRFVPFFMLVWFVPFSLCSFLFVMARLMLAAVAVCVVVLIGSVCGVYTNCVAHRGASGEYPENTITAFKAAEAQGAEWIEFDTQISNDGVVREIMMELI